MIWFLADLRHRIRRAEGPECWLHSVAFAGGLVGFSGVVVYLAVLVAQSNSLIGANTAAASSLLVLQWEYGGVLAPGFAALVGATSLAIVRQKLLPPWLGWLGWVGLPLALGLALSGFLGGFLVVLALLWLAAIGGAFAVHPRPLHTHSQRKEV